mgnify:CR=1 FL=1
MEDEMEIVVIYDGLCEFCQQSLTWIQKKLDVTAVAFQTADLQPLDLTHEQCAKQIHVISATVTYAGADAISYLLSKRGNKIAALFLQATGNLGRAGYRWVASHRSTWPIRLATKVLHFLNKE